MILAGPTASGKSALARLVAEEYDGVIINADSMQIYQELSIVTARPTEAEDAALPHRLYGDLSASEMCSAGRWLTMAKDEITATHNNAQLPIIVGGTGLYLRALMQGLSPIPPIDEEVRARGDALLEKLGTQRFYALLRTQDPLVEDRIERDNPRRLLRAWEVLEQTGQSIYVWHKQEPEVPYAPEQFKSFVLEWPREALYARCNERFERMLHDGALAEVEALGKLNLDPTLPAMKALGVSPLLAHVREECSLEDATTQGQQDTRNYAKRQITWFNNQMGDAVRVAMEDDDRFEQIKSALML